MPAGSYTTSLFESGINRIAQKVGEEALETVIEATNGTNGRLVYEAADMLYHLIVLLSEKGLRIEDLAEALYCRHNKKKEDYDKIKTIFQCKLIIHIKNYNENRTIFQC